MNGWTNLDQLAAQRAQAIVDVIGRMYGRPDSQGRRRVVNAGEADGLVTKALGVLQENGVYAAMLFLLSRSGKVRSTQAGDRDLESAEECVACQVVAELVGLLGTPELTGLGLAMSGLPSDWGWQYVNTCKPVILKHVADRVCENLEPLLLVKNLFEQTLIYARYGAKARAES